MTALRRSPLVAGLVATVLTVGCASSGSGPAAPTATVSGVVLAGPSCPGPVRAGRPCPDRPVAHARVVALSGSRVAASTSTDRRGRFALSLPPGRYLVRATNPGGYPSTAQRRVQLRAGHPVVLTLTVDTGMR